MFRIYPPQNKKINALKKEAKHYHYDWTLVQNSAARFENLIAFHLHKHGHFLQDTHGEDIELFYFRDKEQREVDFVLLDAGTPKMFIETKLSDENPSPHLRYLKRKFPEARAVQVLLNCKLHKDMDRVEVVRASRFLSELSV